MEIITIAVVSFCTGVFASLGIGGGMVLIIYLTLFAGFSQLSAQGINLVFFLPIAVISLVLHTKNKLVEWKKIFPAMISGLVTVIIFSITANVIDTKYLEKGFAIFLIGAGGITLFQRKPKNEN